MMQPGCGSHQQDDPSALTRWQRRLYDCTFNLSHISTEAIEIVMLHCDYVSLGMLCAVGRYFALPLPAKRFQGITVLSTLPKMRWPSCVAERKHGATVESLLSPLLALQIHERSVERAAGVGTCRKWSRNYVKPNSFEARFLSVGDLDPVALNTRATVSFTYLAADVQRFHSKGDAKSLGAAVKVSVDAMQWASEALCDRIIKRVVLPLVPHLCAVGQDTLVSEHTRVSAAYAVRTVLYDMWDSERPACGCDGVMDGHRGRGRGWNCKDSAKLGVVPLCIQLIKGGLAMPHGAICMYWVMTKLPAKCELLRSLKASSQHLKGIDSKALAAKIEEIGWRLDIDIGCEDSACDKLSDLIQKMKQ